MTIRILQNSIKTPALWLNGTGFSLAGKGGDTVILNQFSAYLFSKDFPKQDAKEFRDLAKQGKLNAAILRDELTGEAIVKLSPAAFGYGDFYFNSGSFSPTGARGGWDGAWIKSSVWNYPRVAANLKALKEMTDADLKASYERQIEDNDDYGHPGSDRPSPAPFNLNAARGSLKADIARLELELSRLNAVSAPQSYTVPAAK